MKTIIAFAAVMAIAFAAPLQQPTGQVVLVKETASDNIGLGPYHYDYQLSDGQAKTETAELVPGDAEGDFLRVTGSFTWVDPATNLAYTVNYVADENGFHPTGEHLPKA